MANHISSAEPRQLIRYSDRAARLDQDIIEHSTSLDRRLSWFEATCREPGFSVSSDSLASAVRSYAHKCLPVDAWVKSVGQDFERADSLHSVPSRLTLPEIRAMASTAVDGIAEWFFTAADEIDKYKVVEVPDSIFAAGLIMKAHDLLVNPGKTLERSRAWRKAIDDHDINSDEAKEARFEYSKTNPIGLLKIFGDEGVRRWEELKYDGPFDNAWEFLISPFRPSQVYGAEALDPTAQEFEISPSSSASSPFPALLSIPDWLRDRIIVQNLRWLIVQLEALARALRWFVLPFPPFLPIVPPPLLSILPPILLYPPPVRILPWTPPWLREKVQTPIQPPAVDPPVVLPDTSHIPTRTIEDAYRIHHSTVDVIIPHFEVDKAADCGPSSLIIALEALGLKANGEPFPKDVADLATASDKDIKSLPKGDKRGAPHYFEEIKMARYNMAPGTDKDGMLPGTKEYESDKFNEDEHQGSDAYMGWEDIRAGAIAAGVDAEIDRDINTDDIQQALESGYPVIVTGTFAGMPKSKLPWYGDRHVADKKRAPGDAGNHIVTVTGYNPGPPEKFIINDPSRWAPVEASPQQLEDFMKDEDSRGAVILRPRAEP